MSLFAVLYATNPSTPEEAIAAAFPQHDVHGKTDMRHVQTDSLDASARLQTKPNFDLELLGFDSTISIYFVLDKLRSTDARQQLAAAVRNFLSRTRGDTVVTYMDTIVLKRHSTIARCAAAYTDLLPADGAGWTVVPELEQP